MKKISMVLVVLFALSQNRLLSQNSNPINSNYLIDHAVSPRVLDGAASLFMQDGRIVSRVWLKENKKGNKKEFSVDVIYDPGFKEGMDIRIVNSSGELSKKDIKGLKKYIENNHFFSRMSRDYLYDESTLKIVKEDNDTVVLEYFYQDENIEPYLRYIKRVKGNIYFVNGELEKVVLKNFKPLKRGVTRFEKTVRYTRTNEGGHIVTSIEEKAYSEKAGPEPQHNIVSTILEYEGNSGKELTWANKPAMSELSVSTADTIDVKLGWVLPLLGKPATKLGYMLPRPVGVAGFVYAHNQLMQFTGLKVAFNGGNMFDLENLFMLDDSKVTQTSTIYMAKADVWLFPFLNLMAIIGGGKNDLVGELVLNEDLVDFINGLPDWVDIPNLPQAVPLNSSVTSEIYGFGATLAGAVGNFNLSANYQLMFTKIVEANTTNDVHIITPMVGYMSPFGVNFMLGGQGQFYNTQLKGFFDLEDIDRNIHRLDYLVDFEPIKWNAIVGFYKGFSKHWEMSVQVGFGQRTSFTGVFGYRF